MVASLTGAAMPGHAATPPAAPLQAHAAVNCDDEVDRQAPIPEHPATSDCCIVSACAMGLALLTTPSRIALPAFPTTPAYERHVLLQPVGIVIAPIPHPPKAFA